MDERQMAKPDPRAIEETRAKRSHKSARISREQEQATAIAAASTGQTIAQVTINRDEQDAQETAREQEAIVLSARDSAAVMDALLHPPAANDALRRAAARYKELMSERPAE